MSKISPDKSGYWWAEQENGKKRIFDVAEIGGRIRVLHKNWRTVEQIEASFGIKRWLGQALPPK